MKKALNIFVLILVGVFIVLSLLGRKSDYAAEKAFWKVGRYYETTLKNPESVPPTAFTKVIRAIDQFMAKFPDSRLIPLAYILKGRTHVLAKSYDEGREVFESVIPKFPDNPTIGVQATAEIANTYAIEKDETNLIRTYRRILDNYPNTKIGLDIPIVLAKYYVEKKEDQLAKGAYQSALSHYRRMAREYPDSPVEFYSLRMTNTCYLALGEWEAAVETLGTILLKFPTPKYFNAQSFRNIVNLINTISISQSQNYDTPIKIYNQFIEQHPDHPFNQPLKEVIDELKKVELNPPAEEAPSS